MRETWHLSKSYWERWTPYCDAPYVKGQDFQTFRAQDVNCAACIEVARVNWPPAFFQREFPDTHAQPLPFSPKSPQKSEAPAKPDEKRKAIANVE